MEKTKLSDAARAAIAEACATKGPRKGLFKASAPRSNTLAYAAWQGAMLSINPFKASIAGIIFMTDEQREIMREVEAYFDARPALRVMDRDRASLEALGAW